MKHIRNEPGDHAAHDKFDKPVPSDRASVKAAFDKIDRIRQRLKPLPIGTTTKTLIQEGRD